MVAAPFGIVPASSAGAPTPGATGSAAGGGGAAPGAVTLELGVAEALEAPGASARARRKGTSPTTKSTKNATRRFNLARPRRSLPVPSLCHPNMKPFRGHAARRWILLWSVVVLPACGRTG